MWSRQLSQTGIASSLKFDKSNKKIFYDVSVVSVLVSAHTHRYPIPVVLASNEYPTPA